MALTIEKELEKDLEQFPQVAENATEFIQWYLREQIALEKWRQNRYSPETKGMKMVRWHTRKMSGRNILPVALRFWDSGNLDHNLNPPSDRPQVSLKLRTGDQKLEWWHSAAVHLLHVKD